MNIDELMKKHKNDWIIYAALSNTERKYYVGLTINVYTRIGAYKRLDCKNQRLFYKALKEQGVDNFSWFVLWVSPDKNPNKLGDAEAMYIKMYNAIDPGGYNITSGGNACIHGANAKTRLKGKDHSHYGMRWEWTQEQRDAVSGENSALYCIKWTQEQKDARSGENSANYGKQYTTKTKNRMSISNKKAWANKKQKQLEQDIENANKLFGK